MKIFNKIIIMVSLLMQVSLFGQQSNHTYFIAPKGNDITGDGTKAKPWFSLNKAWAATNAGDVIYLRGGSYYYDAGQILSDKNGAPGSIIKVWAYENEKPQIRPGAAYTGKVGILVKGVNYVHLKGIEICYYEQRTPDQWYSGITAADVNYCIFELLNIHHNGFGMSVGRRTAGNPVTENLFLNCDFHHNYDPITAIGDNFKYGGSDGLTIRVDNPNSINTVKGCRMWNNSDDGFDGWTNAGMLIFDGCWSFNNGFREDGISQGGDGNGFKFGPMVGPPWTGYENQYKRTFVNCVAFCNRAHGFDQNRTYCIKHLYNNIAYKNGYYGFNMNQEKTEVDIVRNNISFKNVKGQATFNSVSIVDHNTFTYNNEINPAYSVTDDDFVSLDTTGVTGARRTNGNLPVLQFLHLKENSDLIGTGVSVDITTDCDNNKRGIPPTLGAFETGH